jgi:hypothetical protein
VIGCVRPDTPVHEIFHASAMDDSDGVSAQSNVDIGSARDQKRLPDNSPSHDHHPTPNQSLANNLLDFLSNASDETLLGILAGLIAATIIVFGRVGLLLIGLFVGIVFHASWDKNDGSFIGQSIRKRELGTEIANRLLNGRLQKTPGNVPDNISIGVQERPEAVGTGTEYAAFRPATADALRVLTDAVIRDYVK